MHLSKIPRGSIWTIHLLSQVDNGATSMRIAQTTFNLLVFNPFLWSTDWAWSLPLIVLTAIMHVSGLAFVGQRAVHLAGRIVERRHPAVALVVVVGATTLLATCLHAIEAAIWATAYWLLSALPDFGSSMLYSLGAITSFGHANLSLEYRWQLMGAMEALNGWLLFGLTTAFLFAVIQKVWRMDDIGTQQ